jgi:hypothetical protein
MRARGRRQAHGTPARNSCNLAQDFEGEIERRCRRIRGASSGQFRSLEE